MNYETISDSEYNKMSGERCSSVKNMLRSPMHFRYEEQHPTDHKAFVIGRAVHEAVLLDSQGYMVAPKCDKRTKIGKETWAEFTAQADGRDVLTEDEHDTVCAIRYAVQSHKEATELLEGTVPESAVQWYEPESGLQLKQKMDAIGNGMIIDLKTCQNAGAPFKRDIYNYHYQMQAAWYLDGVEFAYRFMFVAVEKTAPYGVAVYELSQEAIAHGRTLYQDALIRLADCRAKDVWPGYSGGIVELPKYLS